MHMDITAREAELKNRNQWLGRKRGTGETSYLHQGAPFTLV